MNTNYEDYKSKVTWEWELCWVDSYGDRVDLDHSGSLTNLKNHPDYILWQKILSSNLKTVQKE